MKKESNQIELKSFKNNDICNISAIRGDERFVSRISAMGVTTGATVRIIRNGFGTPLLIHARDTLIAVSKREAGKIFATKGGTTT